VSYIITATIDSSAVGIIRNDVSVTVAGAVFDPVSSNNNATDNTTITTTADLQISKTDNITIAVPGTQITYTITAFNGGPSDAPLTTVIDQFSPVITATWGCTGTSTAVCFNATGTGNITALGSIPALTSLIFVVTASIDPSVQGNLTNTASVGSNVFDPQISNNQATDVDILNPITELSINKTDFSSIAVPGRPITYILMAVNSGPSDAPVGSVSVLDILPSSLFAVSWTCAAIPPAVCASGPNSGTVIDTTLFLPQRSTVSYTVTAMVYSSATGNVTNQVNITGYNTIQDTYPANNVATDVDLLTPVADISVIKQALPIGRTTAVPGTNITYLITILNLGPSDSQNLTVTDLFSSLHTNYQWLCAGFNATCGTSALTSGVIIDNPIIVAGGYVQYTVSSFIKASATGYLNNTASVSVPNTVTDTTLPNNFMLDQELLTPIADTSITKTDGQTSAIPGLPVTYTITITNNGPSEVPFGTVSVLDILPTKLSNVTWNCTAISLSQCGPTGTGTGGTMSDRPSILVGGVVEYRITADVYPSATGNLTNTANVTSYGSVQESVPSNNQVVDDDLLVPSADLQITKTDNSSTSTPGLGITYTIKVQNQGPSDAPFNTVSVMDVFSPLLIGTTWTCTASSGSSCGSSGNSSDIQDRPFLLRNGIATYVVVATIDSSATGYLNNRFVSF